MKKKHIYFSLGWYVEEIHYGVARYAHEAGWRLTADTPMISLQPELQLYDGMLTMYREGSFYDDLEKSDLPRVEFSHLLPEQDLSRVDQDNEAIGRMAAEYFLAKGYTSFCCVHYKQVYHSNLRGRGFESLLQSRNFECHQLYISEKGHERESCREHLIEELKKLPKPVAVFATFDANGDAVLRACEQAGLQVPSDISVLAAGNVELICDWAPVPLSSIDVDYPGQGYESARLLDSIMNGEDCPQQILIAPKGVVERASSDASAVKDEFVRRAMLYIREEIASLKGVNDVSAEAGCSRRKLELLFQQHLRASINEMIISARIDKCKNLLQQGKMPAKEIALHCGFRSVEHLYRQFRAKTGLTSRQYRQQFKA